MARKILDQEAGQVVERQSSENVYVDGEGNLTWPGDPDHAILDATHGMSESQMRKVLELTRRVTSGEFDLKQTKDWTPAQSREFFESLPEQAL
ncbi:MAG: hypothetical protein EOP84_19540 [Verrucomicrobiaceae bacterium]|nr:MAG: hypothetical protein EOP84_19540 [Verrucomicrobiaceae bacterium]